MITSLTGVLRRTVPPCASKTKSVVVWRMLEGREAVVGGAKALHVQAAAGVLDRPVDDVCLRRRHVAVPGVKERTDCATNEFAVRRPGSPAWRMPMGP
jgi:hypothetical protein